MKKQPFPSNPKSNLNPKPKPPSLPLSPFASSQGPSTEIPFPPQTSSLSPIISLSTSFQYLAYGTSNGTFSFFNTQTNTHLFTSLLPKSSGPLTSISPILDNFCICGSSNGTINILNTTSNKLYNPYLENTNAITSIQFNNHYQTFVASSLDNTLKTFKIPHNKSLSTITERYPITTASWMNSLIISGNQNGEINVYDINTSSRIYSKKLFNISSSVPSNISYINIDNENNIITCCAKTDTVLNVLDMRMNRVVCSNKLNCGNLTYMCNDKKYGYVIGCGSNKSGKVINVRSGFKEQNVIRTSMKVLCGDNDDGFVCFGGDDGCVVAYELIKFDSVFGYKCEEKGKVLQCKLDVDKMRVYTGGDDGIVRGLICVDEEF